MGAAGKALWYIESHYEQELALADIAHAVGVSPFHLSRLFQASTGSPIVRYLRGRRLSEAARKLAAGAGDILQVALVAGYSSHGAFTRAFGEQFGRTPDDVREHGLRSLPLVDAVKLDDVSAPCAQEPRLADADTLLIAGIGARHRGTSVASIPSQWQRLLGESRDAGPIAYGVCCNSDEEGNFDYIAGFAVPSFSHIRTGWQTVRIPARRYVVGWHEGHISTIRSTWYWLLNDYLPGSGLTLADAPEFERYDERFDDTTGNGGVEIWLPLAVNQST
ncbi:AraC family transcriptional regulator [Pinirhizobacter sp.]|jgi:AraC family transcriptional regulator|uniref:AraC family transcriptional regulator n=1 Tax=Pinirhizobacter sp. TaxID=2950432 RepID=UPI002F40A96B